MSGSRHIRIPGLVDVTVVDEAHGIMEAGNDQALDRAFPDRGPIVNRLIMRHIRRVLSLDGKPFPTVSRRGDTGRAEAQAALEATLTSSGTVFEQVSLGAIVSYVAQGGDRDAMARNAQQLVGALFVPDFHASGETWEAALTLNRAVQSKNPCLQLGYWLTGKVPRARSILSKAMAGNASGVHAIGIAIHNLVRSFETMHRILPDHPMRRPEEIAALCLAAPDRILRQKSETSSGPGIVVLELEAARARTLRTDIAFMSGTWSMCPAHAWVPAVLTEAARLARLLQAGEGTRP